MATSKTAVKSAKKQVTKKADTKKVVDTKEKFSIKRIGNNVVARFGSKGYSKKFSNEKEIENILNKAKLYDKKPTESRKNEIIKLLTPVATKKSEKAVVAKSVKRKIAKEVKKQEESKEKVDQKSLLEQLEDELTTNPESVDALQTLLDKFKKPIESTAAVATPTSKPRSGEFYGRR